MGQWTETVSGRKHSPSLQRLRCQTPHIAPPNARAVCEEIGKRCRAKDFVEHGYRHDGLPDLKSEIRIPRQDKELDAVDKLGNLL